MAAAASEFSTIPTGDDDDLNNLEKKLQSLDEAQSSEEFEPEHSSYLEESKKALILLKKAHDENDMKIADEVIDGIVVKSMVSGLTKLHTACGYGFSQLVEKYLVEEKADPNSECVFKELTSITPLHFCSGIGPDPITNDRDKCIEILIKNGAKINQLTSRLDTPLHWATKLADFKVCKKLIELGADVNLVNLDNCTCAHGAAFYKNLDTLSLLIDSKVDVNVQDISGKNILHLLCKDYGDNSTSNLYNTESLSEDSKVKNDETSSSSLSSNQAQLDQRNKKFLDLIRRLLDEFKMDPNVRDSTEFTPFMYACEHGNLELLQLLIDYKADINVSNKDGINCMVLAIVNSVPTVVKFLMSKNFDVKQSASNISYITDAAYLNEIEILSMLMEAGCDINETKQDENGVILNPLWAACEKANVAMVELLLTHGANTIIRSDLNMTALHCTAMAQYESLAIAKLLVDYKCPINMKSTQAGETPLFLASNSGYSEIVEYILDLGVDPNESSPLTRTCFQQAVFRGHKDIILLLLNKGYKLTDDDKNDLKLFIMDLYQDNDVDMLNFLLSKDLTDKQQLLDCIKRVHTWQVQTEQLNFAAAAAAAAAAATGTDTDISSEEAAACANLSDLKLDLVQAYPTSIDELDAYLNFKPSLNASNSSEDNEELK